MDVEPRFDGAWDQVARRWRLAPERLPETVTYLYTVLCAAAGLLELIEVRHGPEGERHVYRFTDPAMGSQEVFGDRPLGWDEETELQACEDLWIALQPDVMDDAS